MGTWRGQKFIGMEWLIRNREIMNRPPAMLIVGTENKRPQACPIPLPADAAHSAFRLDEAGFADMMARFLLPDDLFKQLRNL